MLRLPPFTYRQPNTIEEAARILAGEGPSARLVAGGTDLWPNMKRRHQRAETVISLMALDELTGIANGDGLHLGATATLAEVERDARVRALYPGLATAVRSISSPPLRTMGTIGGNICVDTRCTYLNQTEEWRRSICYCMKADGEICWVAPSSPRCWAHTASDSAPMLCALGAEVELISTDGSRTIPITRLYRDDGIEYLVKRPDEILTGISLPADAAGDHCRSAFWKLRRRGSIDFAVLSVAVALWMSGDVVQRASIWLGAVGSCPRQASKAEELLRGEALTTDIVAETARAASKVATPMDNTDFQAQWRKAVTKQYVEAALREAAGLPVERLRPRHGLGRDSQHE